MQQQHGYPSYTMAQQQQQQQRYNANLPQGFPQTRAAAVYGSLVPSPGPSSEQQQLQSRGMMGGGGSTTTFSPAAREFVPSGMMFRGGGGNGMGGAQGNNQMGYNPSEQGEFR